MARFKSDQKFYGIKEGKEFAAGEPFEMTLKRADELKANVKKNHDVELEFTRLDKDEETKSQAEEVKNKSSKAVEEDKKAK